MNRINLGIFPFIFRRLLISLPTLLGVSFLAFLFIRLIPGDPVQSLLGERGASPEVYEAMRAQLGLNHSWWKQYILFLTRVLQGDFGISITSQRPILEEFLDRFPATLELGLLSVGWALLIGIPMGVIAAVQRGSVFDYALMTVALVGYSMPVFWWGLILILFFSVTLGWTPVAGRIGAMYDIEPITGFMLIDSWWQESKGGAWWSALSHLCLPSLALGTIPLAAIARMTRSSMLEVLHEEYVRTAQAKGLGKWRIVFVHALRNALIPIITVAGLMVGSVLTGAILTETIFSWPGIGKWLVNGVMARDYPVIQGGVLLVSVMVIGVNLIVDILYQIVNPLMGESN